MKRREAKMIRQIQDQRDRITDDPKGITQTFVKHMRNKYGPIEVTDNCVAEMVRAIRPTVRTDYAAYLEQPITYEELFTALKSGGRNKAPGSDGINLSSK
jgi:lysophospholipase L1-like esterase